MQQQLTNRGPATPGRLQRLFTFVRRHPTLSIGARRHEKRYTVTASADVPIGHGFILKPEYRGADRNSNYSFTDYTEDMASLSLVYRY